ncbi:MAG: hypothetical protein AMS16_07135, partial [Planctomycetes bacterium DG_58]
RVPAQHAGVKVGVPDSGTKPSKVVMLSDGRGVIEGKLEATVDELQERLKDLPPKAVALMSTDTILRGKVWTVEPKPEPRDKELLEDIARAERVPRRGKPPTGPEGPMRRTRAETGAFQDAVTAEQIRIQLEEQGIRTGLSDGLVFLRKRDFRRAEQKFLAAQLQVKYGDFPTPFKKRWLERIQNFLDLNAKTRAEHTRRVDPMRHREAAVRLQDELVRMKEQQSRIKARLEEQYSTFSAREQYDPEDPTIPEKIKQTTHKKLAAWRHKAQMTRRLEEQYQRIGSIETLTPWYPISVYPRDWKELSDRRLRAVERAEITGKPRDRKVRQQLEETIVTFTFNEQPLAEAIDYLQTLGSVNIVPDRSKLEDPDQTITLKLANVPLGTAIKLLAEQLGLRYVIRDGIVFISDEEGIKRPLETNTYDVRDLVADIPNFRGPTFELQNIRGGRGGTGSIFGDEEEDEGEERSAEEGLKNLESLIRQVVAPGTWEAKNGRAIRGRAGSVIVTHTPETQAKVQKLLDDLRRAKGPQVEMGQRLTEQQAKGVLQEDDDFDGFTNGVAWRGYGGGGGRDVSAGVRYDPSYTVEQNAELRKFITANYSWRWGVKIGPFGGSYLDLNGNGIGDYQAFSGVQLAQKLVANLGQKVNVSSVNLNANAGQANGLGVNFTVGRNGLAYAVIDEAQFRTLMEFSDANGDADVEANPSGQETIVGTDALIANGMMANPEFAADRWNRLNILDNPIKLSHEKYVLINNGSFLTAVRAGAMQHWTQKSAPVFFVRAPQHIDVPKVGRLVRFEKTLIEPKDDLVIRAKIYWKGGAR